MSHGTLKRALRITGIYLAFGILWIWASDLLLVRLGLEHKDVVRFQTLKGSVFVTLTALLIYFLLRRELSRQVENRDELEQSKNLLEATLNSLSEAVFVVNPENRAIILCNRAAETMFGYERDKMIGKPTRMLHVNEKHYQDFHTAGLRELEGKGFFNGEFEMRRADGEVFPTEHQVRAVHPGLGWQKGVVSVIRDLSARRTFERQLEHEQKVREAILENSAECIIVCDEEGHLRYFNRAARELHGVDAIPVNPEGWSQNYQLYQIDGVTPLSKEEIPLYRALQGEKVEGVPMVVAPSGKDPLTILGSAVPLYDSEGNKLGAVTSFHDITDKVNKEIALDQLEIAKRKMVSSEKLAEVGRLASGITHEILNPLNIISLHSQMILKDKTSPSSVIKKIESIRQEVGRIEAICRQLLTFSRSAPEAEDVEAVQVNTILQQVLELIERDSKYESVKFVRGLDSGLPEGRGNRDEFRQVFYNLINNARQAMPEGGRITVKTEAVEESGRSFIRVHVQDTGCGIRAEDLENIFEPFFTTKPEGEGTGMGLAVVHGIIQKYNGSITVHSKPGTGTTFTIDLPAG